MSDALTPSPPREVMMLEAFSASLRSEVVAWETLKEVLSNVDTLIDEKEFGKLSERFISDSLLCDVVRTVRWWLTPGDGEWNNVIDPVNAINLECSSVEQCICEDDIQSKQQVSCMQDVRGRISGCRSGRYGDGNTTVGFRLPHEDEPPPAAIDNWARGRVMIKKPKIWHLNIDQTKSTASSSTSSAGTTIALMLSPYNDQKTTGMSKSARTDTGRSAKSTNRDSGTGSGSCNSTGRLKLKFAGTASKDFTFGDESIGFVTSVASLDHLIQNQPMGVPGYPTAVIGAAAEATAERERDYTNKMIAEEARKKGEETRLAAAAARQEQAKARVAKLLKELEGKDWTWDNDGSVIMVQRTNGDQMPHIKLALSTRVAHKGGGLSSSRQRNSGSRKRRSFTERESQHCGKQSSKRDTYGKTKRDTNSNGGGGGGNGSDVKKGSKSAFFQPSINSQPSIIDTMTLSEGVGISQNGRMVDGPKRLSDNSGHQRLTRKEYELLSNRRVQLQLPGDENISFKDGKGYYGGGGGGITRSLGEEAEPAGAGVSSGGDLRSEGIETPVLSNPAKRSLFGSIISYDRFEGAEKVAALQQEQGPRSGGGGGDGGGRGGATVTQPGNAQMMNDAASPENEMNHPHWQLYLNSKNTCGGAGGSGDGEEDGGGLTRSLSQAGIARLPHRPTTKERLAKRRQPYPSGLRYTRMRVYSKRVNANEVRVRPAGGPRGVVVTGGAMIWEEDGRGVGMRTFPGASPTIGGSGGGGGEPEYILGENTAYTVLAGGSGGGGAASLHLPPISPIANWDRTRVINQADDVNRTSKTLVHGKGKRNYAATATSATIGADYVMRRISTNTLTALMQVVH